MALVPISDVPTKGTEHARGTDIHDEVNDKHTTLISARTSSISKRSFFDRALSAMDPMNGLESTETRAPSAKKVEVYRWMNDESTLMRVSKTYVSNGTINAKSSSSGSNGNG